MQIDICIYHKNCSDGICALFCVKYFHDLNNFEFDSYPMAAGEDLLFDIGELKNKNILFVDVCPGEKFLEDYKNIVNEIIIIDHHERNVDKIRHIKHDNITIICDVSKSGCQLAWDYYFTKKRPWIVEYVADQDLRLFFLKDSRFVNSYLKNINYVKESNFDIMEQNIYDKKVLKDFIEKGKQIQPFINNILQKEIDNSILLRIKVFDIEYNIRIGNIIYEFVSELADKLCELPDIDFSIVWRYDLLENVWKLSFRGKDGVSPDLSFIANKIGKGRGGGHPLMAAATLEKNPFIKKGFFYEFLEK